MIVDHKLTETAQKLVKDSFVVAIIVDDADVGLQDFTAIQEFTQKENVPLIVCGESIFVNKKIHTSSRIRSLFFYISLRFWSILL